MVTLIKHLVRYIGLTCLSLTLAFGGSMTASYAGNPVHIITDEEAARATRSAYEADTKALLAEHPDATAVYECEREKVVTLSPETEKRINAPYSGEKMPPYFTVIVIPTKPDPRCAAGFFDNQLFNKWMWCSTKYKIASYDYETQPRTNSLAEMHSDDGHEFYGTDGLYFRAPGLNHRYLIEYRDEGGRLLEGGTCQKK